MDWLAIDPNGEPAFDNSIDGAVFSFPIFRHDTRVVTGMDSQLRAVGVYALPKGPCPQL